MNKNSVLPHLLGDVFTAPPLTIVSTLCVCRGGLMVKARRRGLSAPQKKNVSTAGGKWVVAFALLLLFIVLFIFTEGKKAVKVLMRKKEQFFSLLLDQSFKT